MAIRSARADAQSVCDRGVAACNRVCAEKLFVELHAEEGLQPLRVPFADRVKALEDDLAAFAWNNKLALFEDPKSIKLNHGTLGFHLSKPFVEELPPAKDEKKTPWALLRDKIKGVLAKALARIRLGAGNAAPNVLSVKVEANKASMLTAVKEKRMTAKQLGKLGFVIVPQKDEFFYELEDTAIQSHSAEPPPAPAAAEQQTA